MHWTSIAITLASAPLARSSGAQLPLSSDIHEAYEAPSSEAPSYRSALLSLHKSLVSISSISGVENNVGSFLAEYLNDRDYTISIQFVKPRENTPEGEERYNILAWRGTDYPNPKVLVTSHIDVVPPHISYGIEDGDVTKDTVITGRGSVDAKGSVAAQITAVEELLASNELDPSDIMLLYVVGEEVSGDGMVAFSESLGQTTHQPHFKAAIFGEPTENRLACGHKGSVACTINARGVGGHSGYPWLGKSANELLVRALVKIVDADLGSSERFGQTTVNIGRLEGGVASNVIPEFASAQLQTRVATGPEKEGQKVVKKRIEEILDEVDKDAFTMDCSQGYGFVDTECDVEGFENIVVNYGTDVPNLVGDQKRYLYGPGTILVAHGDHENITVGDLETSVEGYKKLILHALKD